VNARAAVVGLLAAGGLLGAWWRLADGPLLHEARPAADDAGRFVEVDGVRTYYRVQGHGPPLVLIHGLALSHLTWRACAERLERSFTVYTLDLPGFGYSDKPPGWASACGAGAFVERFLTTLQLERVILVGHSMGGAAALWLASQHPERLERLVVVDAAGIGPSGTIFRVLATPVVGELLLRMTSPVSMRLLMRDAYVHKELFTADMAAAYARFMWSPGARRALIEHCRAYDADRRALRPRIRTVTTPTLVIWTDRDPYFPLEVAHDLLRLLPGASLQVVSDAGHMPHEEQPARVSQLMLDWLGAENPGQRVRS
jgi:pimeloyl-ACP methyl ester carboxylesterase